MTVEPISLARDEIRAKYKNDPNWPIQSFDAMDWADSFIAHFGHRLEDIDQALMLTWFANALMRGYDERESALQAPNDKAALECECDELCMSHSCRVSRTK